MGDLLNKAQEKEKKASAIEKKRTVRSDSIMKKSSGKNKMISAKVNDVTYQRFSKINQARGASNNSILNMLIADYVAANKEYLDD
jgi:uncharacterized membrane protein